MTESARERGRRAERERIVALIDAAPHGSEPLLYRAITAGVTPGQFASAMLSAVRAGRIRLEDADLPATPEPTSANTLEYESGVALERARVAGVIAAELPEGFEANRIGAIRWGKGADELRGEVATTIRDRGVTLEAMRADASAPVPHAQSADLRQSAGWDRVTAKLNRASK